VKYESDTLVLDFLLDAPPYSLASIAYSHGKAYRESLALEEEDSHRYIPTPESLTFHIGDKALHYAYSTRDENYVSRDSVVLGGRVPPAPLYAGLGPMPGIYPQELLDLGGGNRVIRVPKGEPFFLRFWRSYPMAGCGSVEVLQHGPADTLQVAWLIGIIRIPAQTGKSIDWCAPDLSCRPL
jgi:hypothetical protein